MIDVRNIRGFSVFGAYCVILNLGLGSFARAEPNSPTEEGQIVRFSLEDAKRYAVANNNEVKSFRHAVEEARARAGRSTVPFFPSVGVAGGVSTLSSSTTRDSAPVGYVYGSYNLFNGFKDTYQKNILELESEKAAIELNQKELLAGLEVEKYFHDYLYEQSAIKLKKTAIEVNAKLQNIAAKRRHAGLGSEADIMEFELRESVLNADLVLLEQKLEEARIGLRKTLGHEIGSKIEPIGELQHQHLVGDLMSHLNGLKNSNPTLRMSGHNVAIADFQSLSWRSKWLPKLDLEARAGYLGLEGQPTDKGSSVSLSLVLKMDLFTGFESSWERSEGLARKLKSEEDLRGNTVTLVSDTERYYRRLKAIEKSVDLEEQNEIRAQKYYETILREYNSGIKNSQDIKVAAEMLSEVSLRRLRYKYEFLLERIEMEKILGSQVAVENMKDKEGHAKKG